MDSGIPIVAGTVSTVIFAASAMPMLLKAARTKDLASYSLGNILLSNLGNLIHSIYVFHLPMGPVWALHTFYLISTALMLLWYLRFTPSPRPAGQASGNDGGREYTELPTSDGPPDLVISPDAGVRVPS